MLLILLLVIGYFATGGNPPNPPPIQQQQPAPFQRQPPVQPKEADAVQPRPIAPEERPIVEQEKPVPVDRHRRKVTKEEFGDKWPLTVDEGEIECKDKFIRLFHHGGKTYALNGIAKSRGFKPIDPIWKDNPELGDGFKINIGPLLEAAGKLCD